MKIVKIHGGLGNQMFQYAFYRALVKSSAEKVKVDVETLIKQGNQHNGFELIEIFENVKLDIATFNDCKKIRNNYSLLGTFKIKLFGKKKTHIEYENLIFNDQIMKKSDVYLEGFWQSEKYFSAITSEIKKDFSFKNFEDEKNIEIEKLCTHENTVSVHVRRGDYLMNSTTVSIYGGICTLNYYKKCVDYIKKHVENPRFIFFSDDIEWCKENFTESNNIFVDWNKGKNSYRDMQLMSLCKHNIIANSSFSWWGAFLNQNENTIILCPNKWMNGIQSNIDDIVCESWIKVND